MAAGLRLSWAPLLVPFLAAQLAFRRDGRRAKALQAGAFLLGAAAANAPAWYLLFAHTRDLLFGNLGYARLNTLYRVRTGYGIAMTFGGKLVQLKNVFGLAGNLLVLLAALVGVGLLALERARRRRRMRFEVVFLLLVVPFVIAGAMAPTPTWRQYYFAVMPFLALLALYAISDLRARAAREAGAVLLAGCVAVGALYHSPFGAYSMFRGLPRPEALWTPTRVHARAERLRRAMGDAGAKVLTLAPLYAVEVGLPVYGAFATGPFAWRVSPLLPPGEAAARGLPVAGRIEAFLRAERPPAILCGAEPGLEQPLEAAAERLGYRPTPLSDGFTLWRPPEEATATSPEGSPPTSGAPAGSQTPR
jgi:hypothetical protein